MWRIKYHRPVPGNKRIKAFSGPKWDLSEARSTEAGVHPACSSHLRPRPASALPGLSGPLCEAGVSVLPSARQPPHLRTALVLGRGALPATGLPTWDVNWAASWGGSDLLSPHTLPLRMSLTDTFFTLKPTLSPGRASLSASWCISTDFTSVVMFTGAKVTTMPGRRMPVSTRPTGTVPMPGPRGRGP